MSRRPWFPFYPADWLGDQRLMLCSLPARGLWLDMMALMHDGEPYGHLAYGGRTLSPEELARARGISARQCQRLLGELLGNGVCGQTENGTYFSRRMVRDQAERERAREGMVRSRTNRYRNNAVTTPSQTPDVTSPPESRVQSPENPPDHPLRTVGDPPPKRKTAPIRGSQLPEGFAPNAHHEALAAELQVDLGFEFQQFTDYYKAKGTPFKDWNAKLNTWIRNAHRFSADRSKNGRSTATFTEKRTANNARNLAEFAAKIGGNSDENRREFDGSSGSFFEGD
jgi:AraC-like DNA-binding protein